MRTKFKLMTMASALLMLASCTEEQVLNPEVARELAPENNAITFGTYMGNTSQTRAGVTGSYTTEFLKGFKGETWNETQAKQHGFGVFAYYTGNEKYGQFQKTTYSSETGGTSTADHVANFMFNQLVWWDNAKTTDYITKWTYSPTKYWPNEVLSAEGKNEVDDQNNDTSNDPATAGTPSTTLENGGNVSFFAYAPYVDFGTNSPTGINNNKVSGIVAINKKDASNELASAEAGDPILTYKLPATADVKAVDLLWGTRGLNGVGVTGAKNTGVTGDGDDATDKGGATEANKYKESILKSFSTNADLTKQTTGGTIEFAFKHALAKIGGSYTGGGEGDDEDGSTPTHGLMVILDIDDFKGAESGGALEKYLGIVPPSSLASGSRPEWNKYNTKVTINELVIDCSKELADSKGADDLSNLAFDYNSSDWTKNLVNQGDFNLATGQWSNYVEGATNYKQTTVPSTNAPGSANYGKSNDDKTKDAIISEELAEPAGFTSSTRDNQTKAGFESLPIGVTTVAKNVYESETNPLVFIPGSRPIIQFTITYTVRTYDPNLSGKYTEVKQKITKRLYITEKVELNKQYNVLMHLGLTSVKFDAFVSDWDIENVVGTTTSPTDGTSPVQTFTEDIDHVYLPINVGQPKSVAATLTAEDNVKEGTKAYDAGSNPGTSAVTKILTVTNMNATFEGESAKPVELAHVAIQALDESNEPVEWITSNYVPASGSDPDKIEIMINQNTTVKDRSAKLRIIYDNVADEYTINQYGRKVQDGFTVNIFTEYTDADNNTPAGASLASGVTKYYTSISGNYNELDKNGAVVTGDIAFTNVTEGYTLTEGDYTTVSGTTFSTKQYVTTVINPTARTEKSAPSTKALTVTYDGVSVEKAITQDAPVIKGVEVTIGGATSQTYAASITTTGAIKVVARFKDSNDKSAGDITVDNSTIAAAAAANTFSYSITGDWANMTDSSNNTLTMTANTAGGAVDRTATLTITYGTGSGAPEGSATITQKKP